MLRCTIWISSHDLTHHQHISLSIQPRHIVRRRNTSVHFLIILNYTATILPLLPHLSTSPPFRDTIPSTPPGTFFHYSHIPSYLPAPWQEVCVWLPVQFTLCWCKYSSNLARSWPSSAAPNLLNYSLQVHLWVTQSQHPNASPNSLNHGLEVYLWVQLDHGLQVHLQTHSITASKCIFEFPRSWLPSSSPNLTDHSLQVHSITAS
jgi:hypothetical protein